MADEEQRIETNSRTPLLQSDRQLISRTSKTTNTYKSTNGDSTSSRIRHFLRWFLTSKYGHYFVMILVTLDVAGIFADFLISLHVCEHANEDVRTWKRINSFLGILSLLFSCLFMVELLCSIYAFGLSYFKSKFHCFDATAIVASFLVDVLTRGPIEEAGSLIIILRLFRVFKIVEESGTVATEQIEGYEEKIRELREENANLRQRLVAMPMALLGGGDDGEDV